MKTLDLTSLDNSDIKYKIQNFPDGQKNIVINKMEINLSLIINTVNIIHQYPNKDTIIQIKSRLNNWLDLELIICTVASLRELGVEEIHLYIPYILGARSDRKFQNGGNNYLKHVICPVINSLNFKSVTCIDPHSDVLEACINNFKKINNVKLVTFALNKIANIKNEVILFDFDKILNNVILISPDAGANKKIYKLAEQIGYKGDIITCSKDRDVEGKLTKVNVPLTENDSSGYTVKYKDDCSEKDFIIIDDICDGGATFINIAKELKAQKMKGKIYLIVTHGIFSKGFKELNKYFNGIYCTNSYSNIGDYHQKITDYKLIKTNVKQLNVF